MKHILVHVHIFYTNQIDYIINHLKNITLPYDLYITLTEHNKALEDKIKRFRQDSHIEIVENRGYDVWPFIKVLQKINLDEYSYIIKLHTKRKFPFSPSSIGNGYRIYLDTWRKSLYAFLASKKAFNKCIDSFNKYPKLGMITSKNMIHTMKDSVAVVKYAKKYFPEYVFGLEDFSFVAGTMFICRASIMAPLQKMKLTANLFDIPDKNHSTQLAHVLERSFGEVVYFSGYYIDDTFSNKFTKINFVLTPYLIHCLVKIKRFFYRIEKRKYIKTIKVFKIPVYRYFSI